MIEAVRCWQWILPSFCLFVCFSLHFFGGGVVFKKFFPFFLDRGPTIGKLLRCWWWRQPHCSQWIPPSRLGCFGRLLPARLAGSRIWEMNLRLNTDPWFHTCRPHGYPVRWFGLCRLRQHPRQCSLARANAEIRRFSLISLFCSSTPVSHHGWSHSWGRSSLQAHRGRCWRAWRSGPRCCTPPSKAPATEASDILVFVSYRTLVKWNWRGSSVDKDTLRPLKLN